MKSGIFVLAFVAGVAFANPPKPSHSGEAPWVKALPMNRNGEFQKSVVNGDELVVDSRFGWMWQNARSKGMEWYDAYAYCEESTYAGFTDWELPSYWQLQSLANHEGEVGGYFYPVFTAIQGKDVLWSRDDSVSIDQPDNDDRWTYHVRLGLTTWETRDLPFRAMCVRGKVEKVDAPSGAKRFVEEKTDLYRDLRTGLRWTSPRDETINKYYMWTKEMSWGMAYDYCEKLSFAGLSDWRLPTIQELMMLLALDIRHPSIWIPKMPSSMYFMWSSDLSQNGSTAWAIQDNGQQGNFTNTEKQVFGCVHE